MDSSGLYELLMIVSVILSLFMLAIGILNFIISPYFKNIFQRTLHRISGYVFLVLYIIVFTIMLWIKISSGHSLDSLLILHIALDGFLIAVLVTKIAILRLKKGQAYKIAKILGPVVVLLTLAVPLLPMAGELFEHDEHEISDQDKEIILNLSNDDIDAMSPENLYVRTCRDVCHSDEKVENEEYTDRLVWNNILERMNNHMIMQTNGNLFYNEQHQEKVLSFILEMKGEE